MKQIFGLLLLAAAFTACSEDETPVGPDVQYEVISFETSEAMLDAVGQTVVLSEVKIEGYNPATFSNVLCGKEYMDRKDANGNVFDDQLFTTTNGKIAFGSYFTDFKFSVYGANDTWGGFSLSRNFDKTVTADGNSDYSKQFSAWAAKGANGTATFAIAYCNGSSGNAIVYKYDIPKITLKEPRTVGYLHLANATVTAQYKSPKGADYFFKVIATGFRNGTEGRKVEQTLVSGTNIVSDWVRVDCSSLGEVDEIRFSIDTNDKSGVYANCPSYFCIDEIGVVKPVK